METSSIVNKMSTSNAMMFKGKRILTVSALTLIGMVGTMVTENISAGTVVGGSTRHGQLISEWFDSLSII